MMEITYHSNNFTGPAPHGNGLPDRVIKTKNRGSLLIDNILVNVSSEFDEVNTLENIVVNPNIPLLLKDVATVRFGVKDETSISRVNGKESVTIQIIRDNQANIISLSEEVL